jgi:hypothetical protein
MEDKIMTDTTGKSTPAPATKAITAAKVAEASSALEVNDNIAQPYVVDIGSQTKRKVRRLRKGKKSHKKIERAIAEARAAHPNAEILPVVILYRKKDRAKGSLSSFAPFLPM